MVTWSDHHLSIFSALACMCPSSLTWRRVVKANDFYWVS